MRLRWVSSTPLGRPVVPEEKGSCTVLSGSMGTEGREVVGEEVRRSEKGLRECKRTRESVRNKGSSRSRVLLPSQLDASRLSFSHLASCLCSSSMTYMEEGDILPFVRAAADTAWSATEEWAMIRVALEFSSW